MCHRSIYRLSCLVGVALCLTGTAWAGLVGWWPLDEGSGAAVADVSGQDHTGSIMSTPQWAAGKIGGALQFNGTDNYVNCGVIPIATNGTGALSVCGWINRTVAGDHKVCGNRQVANAAGGGFICTVYNNRMEMDFADATGRVLSRDSSRPTVPGVNTWVHLTWVYDDAANTLKLYVDGALQTTATVTQSIGLSTQAFYIGTETPAVGHWFNGLIDDLRLYDHALTDTEITEAMQGIGPSFWLAGHPVPYNGQTDVRRDQVLSWAPGKAIGMHDVYIGTSFSDVNTASRSDPKGILANSGQDANVFDPVGLIHFGQTYYWRVDEINAPPDSTIHQGRVWTFTVEPFAYPLTTSIAATASSSSSTLTGPERTIDGSGLDALDRHSMTSSDMWLSSKSGPTPPWIRYEFDRVYKLHQMWVWNSNQIVEPSFGLGAKKVAVEISTDGATWTALTGVPEFAQAPGEENYAHNTTVDFGGALARYVKLTLLSNWADEAIRAGLSEVRFFYVPVQAYEPTPAVGAANTALNGGLGWRPGREAVKHDLYFGTDPNALSKVGTVTDHRYPMTSLGVEYNRTYYWKVDEVNEAASPALWEGDTWSFTTVGYTVVEDFESYDDLCNKIFYAWVDQGGYNAPAECGGASAPGNGSGAMVGNAQTPYAERTILHGGSQSMPMAYDNRMNPYYSEAQREWAVPQVWNTGGADTLKVYFQGIAPAFLETSPGAIVMSGTGTDIYGTTDQGRFAYKTLSGDGSITARVESLANTNAWAKAGVMIRETLNAGSSWAYIVYGGTNGVHFQARLTTDTGATSDTSLSSLPADQTGARVPVWVKVERKGNQFYGYYAKDEAGTAWTSMAWNPQTIQMASTVYIGLAVTSHAANVACGGRFSSVSTQGSVTGSWQLADLSVTQPTGGNAPETFYVAVKDSAGKMKGVSHPDPVALASGAWEEWNIPLSEFTKAGINLGQVKQMIVGVGDRNAPKAGDAGKVYIDDIQLTRITAP